VEHISINIFEENYRSWDRSPQFIGSWERWSDLAVVHNTHPQLFSLYHRQQYYNTNYSLNICPRLWRIDQTTCYNIGLEDRPIMENRPIKSKKLIKTTRGSTNYGTYQKAKSLSKRPENRPIKSKKLIKT
jgi:hypothetical protein